MHELGIAHALLEKLHERLPGLAAGELQRVNLRLGQLSSVNADSLEFAFDCLARGTRFAGAALVFERVPPSIACDACGHAGAVADLVFRCPRCGSGRTRMVTGQELEVRSVELADFAAAPLESGTVCTTST